MMTTHFHPQKHTAESLKLDLMWTERVSSYENAQFYGLGEGLYKTLFQVIVLLKN